MVVAISSPEENVVTMPFLRVKCQRKRLLSSFAVWTACLARTSGAPAYFLLLLFPHSGNGSTRLVHGIQAHTSLLFLSRSRFRPRACACPFAPCMVKHRDAYLAVMKLVDVIDDTVSCQKQVLSELLEEVAEEEAGRLGVDAESWVPRGNTRAKKDKSKGQDDGGGDIEGEDEAGDEEDEEDSAAEEEEHVPAPAALVKIPALLKVAMHPSGHKVLLLLLAAEEKSYFDPEELKLLQPNLVPAESKDGEGEVSMVPTSKKDGAVRRRELLASLRQPLLAVCAENADKLMRSKFAGQKVLLEVVKKWQTAELVAAVAEAGAAPAPKAASGEAVKGIDDRGHVVELLAMREDVAGHVFMKKLLQWEAQQQKESGNTAQEGTVWFAD